MTPDRPDPGQLLERVRSQAEQSRRGRLKVFFGAAPGVGKTYAMLQAARRLFSDGVDVVVGVVETHGRAETESLLLGLELLPLRVVEYRGSPLKEFDLDAALHRQPEIILLDELAHTNVPGAGIRHEKRWQDVQTLLEAGISVFTTVNVQHVESLNDIVQQITGVAVRETIPDSILEQADEIELVDLPPEALLDRMRQGKVYVPDSAREALANFFRKGNLTALRELSLRRTAEHVDGQMRRYKREQGIAKVWPAGPRLLVAIGPSPTSATLLRAAKRMAIGMHAQLIAAYVDTPTASRLSQADKERVTQSLRLAEQLGAETVTLSGRDVSRELIVFARSRNVNAIVVGKPVARGWRDRLRPSPVDELIRRSDELDVYVIRAEESVHAVSLSSESKPVRRSPWPAYFTAFLVVILATVLSAVLFGTGRIDKANISMVYLLGVLIAAAKLGRGPSVVAVILSVAAFDFFFVPPHLTFAVSDTQYLITFAVMLAAGLLISTLTTRVREQAASATEREHRTAALYSMSRELAAARTLDDVISVGTRHLRDTFHLSTAVFLPDEHGKVTAAAGDVTAFTLNAEELGLVQWAFDRSQSAGRGTNTLPSASCLAIPLSASRGKIGVIALRPQDEQSVQTPAQSLLIETFVNQIAQAIERGSLIRDSQRAQVEAETERLRSALLSSVSHDLRTPLAAITGAASALLESPAPLNDGQVKELLASIHDESQRLGALIDNLVFATRLESGAVEVHRDWVSVEELVGAGLSRVRPRLGKNRVRVNIPADLPLVRADGVLIEQVLINLLENAASYAGEDTTIDIAAWQSEQTLVTEVADDGTGLPSGMERRIFDRFQRGTSGRVGGLGLGLTICKGIVRAHGGRIWAENRQPHGASFRFSLPLDPQPELVPSENPPVSSVTEGNYART